MAQKVAGPMPSTQQPPQGACSASSKAKTDGAAKSYKVTAKSGLNVRSGPSTSYGKYGALVCGAELQVEGIENGWAKVSYNGKTAYVSASYIKESGGGGGDASAAAPASASGAGFKISAVFVRENWTGGGRDKVLDCGQFELDSVDASGPPEHHHHQGDGSAVQRTDPPDGETKAWEAYTLSGIANEMAAANGMTCMFLANSDPVLWPRGAVQAERHRLSLQAVPRGGHLFESHQ